MANARSIRKRAKPKPALDAVQLRAKLHARLDQEKPVLERWLRRLLRTFHAYEKQLRRVAHLQRRLARLEQV